MKRKLGKEQLVGYWTISTNIVLVLTTFWLGLAVQDFVADRNANVSAVLANVEYVECVKPHVDSLNIQYNSLLYDIDSALIYWNNTGDSMLFVAGSVLTFLSKNHEITQYYDDLLGTSEKVMYYIDDANLDSIIEGNMVSKIGVLYGYKELLDFYFDADTVNVDTVNSDKQKTVNDCPILEHRLKKLFMSPDYIRITGLNIHFDEVIDKYLCMYKGFFQKDGETPNLDSIMTTINQSFLLALDIHKILNDNRVYRQKESKIRDRILKAPWSILFISIFAFWIIFTIIVFITTGKKNNSEDESIKRIIEIEKALTKIDARYENIFVKLDCTESKCKRTQTEINESVSAIQKQIDDIKNHIGDTE